MAGLYIHIPFCRSRCAYCDFYSVALRAADPARFVDALIAELEGRVEDYPRPFETVYIGGGTPSSLPAGELTRLVKRVVAEASRDAEVTVEVNPDDVTLPLVESLAEAGINRVSMGVQSLIDSELAAITRRHDAEGTCRAVETIRRGGINNLSLDLIYGLPGQTPQSWVASIEGVLDMRPEHISAYLLSYEPGTRLTRDLTAGRITQATDTQAEEYYLTLCRALSAAGYEHYEISNFALPGYRSGHNSSYWNPAVPYLGLGPAAHSYDGNTRRRANYASVRKYMDSPVGAADPELCETLTDEQKIDERIMLALRTADGLALDDLPADVRKQMLDRGRVAIASGNLALSPGGDRIHIPEERWLIADTIISELFI